MQTLHEIRGLLKAASLTPLKQLGQNFLIDQNLMAKLLTLAEPAGRNVLEVGPGTGSLTGELLGVADRVVAVEIDRGLHKLLRDRFAEHVLQKNLVLIHGDVLTGKHAISAAVLAELRNAAHLVSNLPYNIATPLLVECLLNSWRACRGDPASCMFERLTFTVQRELADRLTAKPLTNDYGPVSVITALLGRCTLGPTVPPQAFWPRPKVPGRIVRIDFDSAAAERLKDATALQTVLSLAFGQRRKQIGSVIRRCDAVCSAGAFAAALEAAEIERTHRAENVPPKKFLALANALRLQT
ncbi:MAG: 16S rRNA (adenine(1518)-N(6)/adenine(1519)-N(6))-dimethyltransferase RsmA [Planctomycetota bacterium]|nr:16S rRNA (adenine(1518)-N(6)/adenine(1519)-N(6))-dimethyltransferase RsmA [Planctomycetota bacterium]